LWEARVLYEGVSLFIDISLNFAPHEII